MRLTFLASATTAANPHKGVQERISLIAGFHGQVDTILIAARVDAISHGRVVDFLQYVLGAREPPLSLDNDESRGFIRSLEQVVGAQVGSRVFGYDLSILTAGLFAR
jgi:hypothetical protein